MNKDKQLKYLLTMIFEGYKNKDLDQTRTNAEELNDWLIKNKCLAE